MEGSIHRSGTDPGSPHSPLGGAALVEVDDLNARLRTRLDEVVDEEAEGAGRFRSSRPIFVTSAIWFTVGAILWISAILVW